MDPAELYRFLDDRAFAGRLAVLNGWITEEQLEACLSDAAPLEEVLVRRGLVTPAQMSELFRPAERKIGRFVLDSRLGVGGAGVVWKGWDSELRRWVAIKEIRGAFSRDRFLREARAALLLRHPHLVEAYELGRDDGRDFLVMAFVEGRTLDEARPPLPEAVRIVAEVAEAVAYMHSRGIVHRDIKPQNILVAPDGRGVLGDFGLAKDFDLASSTMEGAVMGTPSYMAPEQATAAPVSPATDVYGLGATLYHAVTGRAPYDAGADLAAVLQKVATESPPPASGAPPEIQAILHRSMAREPGARCDARGLAEQLRSFNKNHR